MDQRKVIENYYSDICNLTELLNKLVNSYRLLVGAAGEYNIIALATKKDVKKAIHRANELGEVIDKIIDVLEDSNQAYLNYCKIKSEIIDGRIKMEYITTEINDELQQKNQK